MTLLYDADALDEFLKFVSFEDGPLIALHARRGKYGVRFDRRLFMVPGCSLFGTFLQTLLCVSTTVKLLKTSNSTNTA